MISSDYAKLPYFTPNTKLPNQALAQDTIGKILKTCKNEFDWLKMIFSGKKTYSIICAKFQVISSDYAKLPYFTPNTKLPNQALAQDTIGEILKTCKNEFDWLKMIFIKEGIFHHFCKVSSDFKTLCQVTIFHPKYHMGNIHLVYNPILYKYKTPFNSHWTGQLITLPDMIEVSDIVT